MVETKNSISLRVWLMMACVLYMVVLALSWTNVSTASANSAPYYVEGDTSSGIVFRQSEFVCIESEDLYIKMDTDTATVTAEYTMKNISNQSLNVDAMFVSPVEYGSNKDFSIMREGESLTYSEEFFGLGSTFNSNKIEKWEAVLANIKSPSKPFGVGDDFVEYNFGNISEIRYNYGIETESEKFAFYYGDESNYIVVTQGKVSVKNVAHGNGIEAVSSTPIADIYDYIFQKGCEGASDEQLRFAEQQFNEYLYYCNFDELEGLVYTFNLQYVEKYISAVKYNIAFAPHEQVKIKVSYVANLGKRTNSRTFRYYLTPARYWKDFANLKITLELCDEYNFLENYSPYLSKDIDRENVYYGEFAGLPNTELYFEAYSNNGYFDLFWILGMGILIFYGAIGLIYGIPVVIVLIVCHNKAKGYSKNIKK